MRDALTAAVEDEAAVEAAANELLQDDPNSDDVTVLPNDVTDQQFFIYLVAKVGMYIEQLAEIGTRRDAISVFKRKRTAKKGLKVLAMAREALDAAGMSEAATWEAEFDFIQGRLEAMV